MCGHFIFVKRKGEGRKKTIDRIRGCLWVSVSVFRGWVYIYDWAQGLVKRRAKGEQPDRWWEKRCIYRKGVDAYISSHVP